MIKKTKRTALMVVVAVVAILLVASFNRAQATDDSVNSASFAAATVTGNKDIAPGEILVPITLTTSPGSPITSIVSLEATYDPVVLEYVGVLPGAAALDCNFTVIGEESDPDNRGTISLTAAEMNDLSSGCIAGQIIRVKFRMLAVGNSPITILNSGNTVAMTADNHPIPPYTGSCTDTGAQCEAWNIPIGTLTNGSVTVTGAAATCDLTSATWSTLATTEGNEVSLNVAGTNCNGKSVSFMVYENDLVIDNAADIQPANAVFSGDTATSTWTAERDELLSNSEYYFIATETTNLDNAIRTTDDLIVSAPVDSQKPTITGFSAPANSTTRAIPITFSAEDNVGVTGYKITTSSTAPLAGDTDWLASAPNTFTVAADGTFTLFPWAKDAIGNVSNAFATPQTVEVDTVPPSNPLSHWKLDEGTGATASDAVSANHGTVANASWINGQIKKALSFNGSNGYVNIPDDNNNDLDGFTSMTVSAWINADTQISTACDSVTASGAIVSKYNSDPSVGVSYLFVLNNRGGENELRFHASGANINSTNTIPKGKWINVVGVWGGGGNMKLYVDGAEIPGTATGSAASLLNTTVPVNIGRIQALSGCSTGPSAYFKGKIDDVRIYNGALSPAQIRELYDDGLDTEKPVVSEFDVLSPSSSRNIAINSLIATDNNDVISGYMITTNNSAPSVDDANWAAAAPTSFTVAADGSHTLYPWVKDPAGNVSSAASPVNVIVDTVKPTVTATVPANTAANVALNSPITITWSENIKCTLVDTTNVKITPAAGLTRTSCSANQAVFSTSGQVNSTSYAVNVSAQIGDLNGNSMAAPHIFSYATVAAPDTTKPVVATFTVPGTSDSRTIPITAFTATDNSGSVTGYKITATATPPAAGETGWAGTAPNTFTVATDGSHTLYPWVKDAAGNVSSVYGTPKTVVVTTDTTVAITNPVPGSTLSGDTVTFNWENSGLLTVTAWGIEVGTTPGGFDIACVGGTCDPNNDQLTSVEVTDLPIDGSQVYVILWYKVAGNWRSVNYTYTAFADIDDEAPITTANPLGGSFKNAITVTLNVDDAEATTYYTTNESTPTTSSTVYTAPIEIPATTTLKFFSVDLAGNAEAVQTQVYRIDTDTPQTVATPPGGHFSLAQTVTLDTGESDTTTYYTLNPSETPTTPYTTPINIASTTTLKFYSADSAGNAEAPQTEVYTIRGYVMADFIALVGEWLSPGVNYDISGDDVVNSKDIGIMMSNWVE